MAEMILLPPQGVGYSAKHRTLRFAAKLILEIQELPKGSWKVPFAVTTRALKDGEWHDKLTADLGLVITADAAGKQGLRKGTIEMPHEVGSGSCKSDLTIALRVKETVVQREHTVSIKHDVGDRVFLAVTIRRFDKKTKRVKTLECPEIEYLCRRQGLKEKFEEFLDWQYAAYYIPPIASYKRGIYECNTIWDRVQEKNALVRISTTGNRHRKGSVCSTLAGQFLGYWLNYHDKFKFTWGASMAALLEGYGPFVTTKVKGALPSFPGNSISSQWTSLLQDVADLRKQRAEVRKELRGTKKKSALADEKQAQVKKLTKEIKDIEGEDGEIDKMKKPWKWDSNSLFKALSKKDLDPGDILVCSSGGHVWLIVKTGSEFPIKRKYVFGNGLDADKVGGDADWYEQDCKFEGWYLIHASGPGNLGMVYYKWALEELEGELSFWKLRAGLDRSKGLRDLNGRITHFDNRATAFDKARKKLKPKNKEKPTPAQKAAAVLAAPLNIAVRYWNRDVKKMNARSAMAYGVKEYRERLEQLIREIDAVLTASADFTKVPEAQAALRAILQARKSAEKAPAKKVPASAVKKLDEISLRRPLQPPEGLGTENFHPGGLYSDTETWEQLATAVEKQVSSVNKRVAAFNTRIAETNDDLLTLMRAIKKLSEPPSMRLVRTIEHIERQVRELNRKTVDKSLDAIEGELDDLSSQTKLLISKDSLEAGADLAYKGTGIRKSLGKKARKSIINQMKTKVEKEEKKPVSKRRRPPYLELDPMEVNVFMLFRSTPLPWMNGHIILDGDKLQIARTMVQKSGVWSEYFEPYKNKTFQVVHLKHDVLNDDGWVADSGALTAGQDCRPLAWGPSS